MGHFRKKIKILFIGWVGPIVSWKPRENEGKKRGKKAGGKETTLLGNCFLWSDRYFGGGGLWHRAPEVTCYLAGSTLLSAKFNTKWSLRCCSPVSEAINSYDLRSAMCVRSTS